MALSESKSSTNDVFHKLHDSESTTPRVRDNSTEVAERNDYERNTNTSFKSLKG